MVVLRTKISDLSKIKRLNCWGSELADVSILRRMSSVQVLSLRNRTYSHDLLCCSINKIENLEDFQYCKKLEELYIRQNNIKDLNQVYYLKNLANLKHLWLGENPCANVEGCV
ncbi:leucine rich repeat protein [Holotrichia oblita]|uniref:Leucine rich repeat protein n=1 Tax=Holotrichia oblita TaxID=644536 RepID=A0ACB9TMK0_HOLOL|nr:leucine rich repeat protein [Holotrichia oblita]